MLKIYVFDLLIVVQLEEPMNNQAINMGIVMKCSKVLHIKDNHVIIKYDHILYFMGIAFF